MANPTVTYSAIILSHFNSAVNPLLYAYHLKDFRGALSRLFRCTSQPDSLYRPSLISQHQQRMSEHYYSRRTFEPKIYIDSPVWRRQMNQQQQTEKTADVQKINDADSGLHISDTVQHLVNDISGIEKLSSIIKRRSSQSNKSNSNNNNHTNGNSKKIFFISDSGSEVTCEPQNSSLYAIVKRNHENGNSV